MFCSKCGKEITNGAAFCSGCGTSVTEEQQTSVTNNLKPGFSEKVNDPSLQSAINKNNKGSLVFTVIMILLPIIIAFFIGISDDNLNALPIGLAVSAVMLIFNLVSFAKKKSEKQWDGVVIDKKSRMVYRQSNDDGEKSYTEYTIVFRDDNGKKRKLKEGNPTNSAHPYYDYLNIGDRVRYYPQFNCFYEKYDKTKDTYLFCAICGSINDIIDDNCKKCDALLIK